MPPPPLPRLRHAGTLVEISTTFIDPLLHTSPDYLQKAAAADVHGLSDTPARASKKDEDSASEICQSAQKSRNVTS